MTYKKALSWWLTIHRPAQLYHNNTVHLNFFNYQPASHEHVAGIISTPLTIRTRWPSLLTMDHFVACRVRKKALTTPVGETPIQSV